MKKYYWGVLVVIALTMSVSVALAAVGCTLNDPDRDIRRIFPEATNYKTDFISIQDHGGEELVRRIEEKLGDTLKPPYETIDVPYAYYTVLRKKEVIGYVHGVNQKGMYGGMQLIMASGTDGVIKDFYYQKLSSPESKKFKDKEFTEQFVGLTLDDILHDEPRRILNDPSEKSNEDFLATMRGLKKNVILLNTLLMNKE